MKVFRLFRGYGGFSPSGVFINVAIALAVVAIMVFVFRVATKKEEESSLGEVFVYDLEELRRTDPSLVKYEEAGRIPTGFQSVSAVAVDSNDRIYVAGDRSVRVFDSNGDVLSEVELTDAPRCLTVGNDGNIYIGLSDHVEVYNSRGILAARWENPGGNAVLTSIAVSGDDVFAADAGGRVVVRYDRSGGLVSRIGEKDEERNIPGFIVPGPYFDLAVAPDGLLRVANPGLQRIEAYTFDGYLELSWGEASMRIEGFSGCYNPVNFAILPDGKFVTCEKGLPRVKIYNADGVFESVVAGAELFAKSEEYLIPDEESDRQTASLDVAVDSQGRIMVLDPTEKAVRIFTLLKEWSDD